MAVTFGSLERRCSLYFFDDEFYTDVKTLNEQENGGIGVVLGRKVIFRRSNESRLNRSSSVFV
jgi:hypothetical protein